jgi:mannosyltransferase
MTGIRSHTVEQEPRDDPARFAAPTPVSAPGRRKVGQSVEVNESGPPPLTRLARNYAGRAGDHGWITGGNYLWLLVALAGGFALRVNRLAVQSLWNDEGTSIALARLSLSAIMEGAAHDIHPPLYYFLLHSWIAFGGAGEFAVRSLSVLAGVLLIAVTFRIAREFFDQEVAVIAAFLSALSAFQLYYSQETRMYMLVALWSALSVWAMVRMLFPSPQARGVRGKGARGITIAWLAYIFTTSAALYTHYFAFTLILFENLAFLAWLGLTYRARQPVRQVANLPGPPRLPTGQLGKLSYILLFWIAAQVVVAVAFLPWLAFAGNQLTSWPAISESLSPLDMVSRVLSAFVFKIDTPLGVESWIVAAYLIFFVAGLLPSLDLLSASVWGIILAALWALVPLAAMYGVSLQRPAYDPKFLLLATPGFFILVARGLSILNPGLFLRERARRYRQERNGMTRSLMTWQFLLTFGVAAGGALIGVRDLYFDPRFQRDDYRGIARYINERATADDVVVLDAPGQIDVFRYYYRGAAAVQTLPIGRPMLRDETYSALVNMNEGRGNIFAVFWATEQADPERFVERYLGSFSFKAIDEWNGSIRLAQYAQRGTMQGMVRVNRSSKFGDEIWLQALGLPGSPVEPGRVFPVFLQWSAPQKPTANYKVFVHLLDSNGRIVSQRDSEPLDGFKPTGNWIPNQPVEDSIGLLVPPHTPLGEYTVEAGLYRPEDGTRLLINKGYGDGSPDRLILGTVRVEE